MSDLRSPPPGSSLLALSEKARRASLTKANLEQLVEALQRRNAELETSIEVALGPLPAGLAPIRVAKKKGPLVEATYTMLLSDAHMGERVRPEQIGGRNEYTPEIAQERMEQYFLKNLVILNSARSAWDVNQLLWWLGGDLQTGYIHEEYESENYLSPTEELYLVYETILRGARFILDRYDVERITIATSNGNHGRGQKKPRTSDFRTSYEFLLYRLLQRALADEPRIKFQLGLGYENVVDVYGFKIRFHHGDAIQYGGGVGGIAPALYRRIHRVNSAGNIADLDAIGHFHQIGFPPRVVMNGSVIGYNAFAQRIGAAYEEPAQASFVIDSKHKVPSNLNPILVREPRRGRK